MIQYDSFQALSSMGNSAVIAWRTSPSNVKPEQSALKRNLEKAVGIITAEVAFGLLVLTSVIELVVYAVLAVPCLVLCPITDYPFRVLVSLLADDVIALIATATNLFYHNLFGNGSFSNSREVKT